MPCAFSFFFPLWLAPLVTFSSEFMSYLLHRSFGEGVMWSNLVFVHSFIFICL